MRDSSNEIMYHADTSKHGGAHPSTASLHNPLASCVASHAPKPFGAGKVTTSAVPVHGPESEDFPSFTSMQRFSSAVRIVFLSDSTGLGTTAVKPPWEPPASPSFSRKNRNTLNPCEDTSTSAIGRPRPLGCAHSPMISHPMPAGSTICNDSRCGRLARQVVMAV